MLAAPGANIPLSVGGEDQSTHPVVGGQPRPGQGGGDFSGHHGFQPTAAKEHAVAQVEGDQQWPLPLLPEHLGVGLGGARRDPPVDGADIVSRLVGSDLLKIHTPAAIPGSVATPRRGGLALGEKAQVTGLKAQLHQLADAGHGNAFGCGQHRRRPQAEGTQASNPSSTRSGVMPPASASKLRMMRWRNTSWNTSRMSSGVTNSRPASQALALLQRSRAMVALGLAP